MDSLVKEIGTIVLSDAAKGAKLEIQKLQDDANSTHLHLDVLNSALNLHSTFQQAMRNLYDLEERDRSIKIVNYRVGFYPSLYVRKGPLAVEREVAALSNCLEIVQQNASDNEMYKQKTRTLEQQNDAMQTFAKRLEP